MGAGERKGRISGAGPTPALPLALRVVVVTTILLLVIYTVLNITRQGAAPASPEAGLPMAAGLLAARAEAALTPAELAAQASAEALAADPANPLDRAEQALRLGRPGVLAAAVFDAHQLTAQSGAAPGLDWRPAMTAARAAGRPLWLGQAPQQPGRGLVYVVAKTTGPQGAVYVATVSDLGGLMAASGAPVAILATRDGALLASRGVTPAASNLSAPNLASLGIDAAAAGRQALSFWGETVPGRRGRVQASAAASPSGQLIAIAGAPAAAGSGDVAASVYTLMAPLLIGCGLTVLLMLQTRRAETARVAQVESERKFRLAVEAARCGIWEWRLREQRVFMSDVTGVMLGWGGGGYASSDEVISRIAPEHRERVRKALQGASSFGAFDVSFCVPKAEGGMSWIDARGQAFGEPDAEGYATLIGVALDVTDERAAEHRAQAAERRLHDAIDSVSEAFVLWNRRDRLVMCNQNFRDFFGLETRVLKPGAPRDQIQKMAELAVRQRRPAPEGRRGVYEVEMAEGRWLQISERRTADGGLVMTAADITAVKRQEEARRRNEEALQHAVARLEESGRALAELAEKYQAEKIRAESANTAKGEFLANMSHELRTPLNAINGFSEMMVGEMFGPLGDRRYREYARDILSSGQHLLALINDILDMSKIEAGKMTLNLDWVDVGELIDDAVRLMHNRAETAGLELITSVTPGLPELEADYRALKQVLLNLLSNALKFTPAGGRVEVRAWELGEETGQRRLRVSVTDTGIGIAKKDISRLARPFEQIETQHAKTQQGTGLGLALTKSLIELHGGVFVLDSEPGLGTTATFTLPVSDAPRPGSREGRPDAAATAATA